MTVIRIADVPIELVGEDAHLQQALESTVLGCAADGAPPSARIELRCGAGVVPPIPPDDDQWGLQFWSRPEGPVLRSGDLVLDVDGPVARVSSPDPESARWIEPLTNFALCWLLAPHDRYLIHAAAVGAEADDALLVFGHSGSGKSTTVFAALEGGWWALSDDLVVLEPAGDGLVAHGVRQPPAAPVELGGRLLGGAEQLGDPRLRGRIDVGVLAAGRRRVAGSVLVGHSADPDGELVRLPGHEAMPLVVQSFAAAGEGTHRQRFVPLAARLSRLPSWHLGHSSDPERRRDVALDLLQRCSAAVRSDVSDDAPSPR